MIYYLDIFPTLLRVFSALHRNYVHLICYSHFHNHECSCIHSKFLTYNFPNEALLFIYSEVRFPAMSPAAFAADIYKTADETQLYELHRLQDSLPFSHSENNNDISKNSSEE